MGPPYIGPPRKPPLFDFEWIASSESMVVAIIIALILVTCVMFLPMIFGWV